MFDVDKLNIYWNGDSKLFGISESSMFNELLEIEKKILLHPRNAHMLFMPVIDDLLKQDARSEIIGRLKKLPLKDPTTFLQALTPHKNVEKGLTFVKSKFGVGIVALDITGHAVFMSDDINISQFYNNLNNEGNRTSTKLLFEGLGNNYSLTSMYDSSGRIISEVQSQTMNSQVDAGKDPYAVGLGINNQTLNMIMYLTRRGVPIITSLKFINQPLIQQYLEAQRINESFINKQRGEELRKTELIDLIYATNELPRPTLNRNFIISEKDLNNGILNNIIDGKQAMFFEYFLALVDEVSAFNDIKNSMTVDTKGKKDKASVENFNKLQEKVNFTQFISSESLDKLRNDGILSSFYNAQKLYEDFYSPMYLIDSSVFGPVLKSFRDMMEDRQKGVYLKDRVRTTIENDFMVFLIQNFHDDFSLDKFNQIFGISSDESIAKQIQDLQSNPALQSNPVLRAFLPLLSIAKDKNENKLFDALRLFERELTTIDVNDYIDAMKDIRDEISEDLYQSIVQLSIYQAGFLNSPFSLNKILPTFNTSTRTDGKLTSFTNDYLRDIQTSVLEKLSEIEQNAEVLFESFRILFYLNNPQFLPKRYWKKSPIPYYNVWNKERQERVLRYITGSTNIEIQPLGNSYFKRYFIEMIPAVNIQPVIDEGEKTQWARTSENGYELSTAGDKRFSALVARLSDGRTIEEAYQLDIKGYRKFGNDWRLGKGKKPLNNMSFEESWNAYKSLWIQWANENPKLIEELREKSKGKVLTDKFASTDVSQARAFAEILNGNINQKTQPQQLDLFSGLSEPISSMEDQMYMPEELKEAKEAKENCKGTPKIIK